MEDNQTKGTILVVDDDHSVREIVSIALRDAGYLPVMAMDGKDALELTSRRQFDLMFLDMKMPGFHGQDILTLMKAARPEMPIVMLTAVVDQEAEDEAFQRGATAYLKKPCNLKDIVETAEAVLAGDITVEDVSPAHGEQGSASEKLPENSESEKALSGSTEDIDEEIFGI
ncbi:MAG: response regulator [Dehalococcoidia bacterium]